MTQHTDERPHLTDARIKANQTYQRRRARTALDMLLEIDPRLWDEATRKGLLETLPRLAEIEPWEIAALQQYEHPRPPLEPMGGWCDYANETGTCTLTAGHKGDHDPDPYADGPDQEWLERMAAKRLHDYRA